MWSFLCHKAEHSALFSSPLARVHTATLGTVMLGYQLLDMLVWCNGWREDNVLRKEVVRTSFNSPLPPRLGVMIKLLEDWTSILPAAQELASASKQKKTSMLSNPKMADSALTWTISNLLHVSKQKGQAAWHKILMNVYAMAFVIRWFSPVSSHNFLLQATP